MTAQRDDAILNLQGDGVEDVAVAHTIVGQLFSQLGLQFLVGDVGTADLNVVADSAHALDFVNTLVGVHFVFVQIDGAGKRRNPILHIHFHVLELRLVQPGLRQAGSAAVVGCKRARA
jgi:hypothetical protein